MTPRLAHLAALVILGAACDRVVELHTSPGDASTGPDALAPDALAPDVIPTDCATPLPCPLPGVNRLTLCGAIYDLETDAPIANPGPGAPCSAGAGGPCALHVGFFDALEFAMGPFTAVPKEPRALVVDTCGRFRATDLPEASFGFMAIAIADPAGADAAHLPTMIAIANADAHGGATHRAYATRLATATRWTTAAGETTPLAQTGVLAMVFRYHGVPVVGVRPRRSGPATVLDALYFADVGSARTTIAVGATATGPNGTALVSGAGPTPDNYDAVGGEPPGCAWRPGLAARIPGVVMVDARVPTRPDGTPCP